MKIRKWLAISGICMFSLGGYFYFGNNNAVGAVSGVDSPVLVFSAAEKPVRYRDHIGEYTVRNARIVINGFGFRPGGGGVIKSKHGEIRVSRYALRFDDAPFPMSDLQVTGKNGTRLSGVVRVPVEMLTDTEVAKTRSFQVYDRVEGRFIPVASEKATTVRFNTFPSAVPACP
jgi:hypothetical protein